MISQVADKLVLKFDTLPVYLAMLLESYKKVIGWHLPPF